MTTLFLLRTPEFPTVEDLGRWLDEHGIKAQPVVEPGTSGEVRGCVVLGTGAAAGSATQSTEG